MKRKLAIVASRGGMKSAFTAGFCYALGSELKFTNPDIMISVSGSSGTFAYYVSGQYSGIKRIWLKLLSTKKFVDLKRFHKRMDIDYLIDEVFGRQEPLDLPAVKRSKIKWFIGVTHADSGRAHFFSNRQKVSVMEAMRASKAIPILYNKKVKILGKEYLDGGIAIGPRKQIRKAIEAGATDIIYIDTEGQKQGMAIVKKSLLWFYCLFENSQIRLAIRKMLKRDARLPHFSQVKILSIVAPSKMKLNVLDTSRTDLKRGFELGRKECLKNKRLHELLRSVELSS